MKSPCIKLCKLNDRNECIGCGRSLEQIKNWGNYTDKEREDIIRILKISFFGKNVNK